MITGFNTDIKHNDRVYHIQTEDKGLQNPYVESLVYVGGEILASKKTSYADQVPDGIDEKKILSLMEQQHRTMIAAIKRGRLDPAAADAAPGKETSPGNEPLLGTRTVAAPNPVAATAKSTGDSEEKTLDQVIIDYLASEAETEHLELALLSQVEFISGQPAELRVCTRRSLTQAALSGAVIEVRVISTVESPRTLFKGKTGPDGAVAIKCDIPVFRDGTAAVIISAQSPIGNDEIKQLVKKKK